MQQIANAKLIELSKKYDVKLVCTNDVHFVDEENAEAHDRLICLSTGKDLDDPNRMLYSKQEWMKTKAEMNELFADVPEALSNTADICDQVEFYSIDNPPIMPNFEIPEDFGTEEGYRAKYSEKDLFDEFTQDENGNVVMSEEAALSKIDKLGGYDKLYRIKLEADYLKKLALEGARKRYGDVLDEETSERIKFELHIMKTMGFPGYFLIVQDFIRAAREDLDVSVGPGRGSAAGSAVAYCLGITQIDPIKYDLLFERFLNPDRISLPDIDVDFDDDGRGRVLNWVTLQEPGVLEQEDGSLYYWMRTNYGCQYEAESDGDIEQFTTPHAGQFTSPPSPMQLKAYNGTIYTIYNPIPNYNGRVNQDGTWGRTPFVLRKSTDGKKFGPLNIIEDDESRGYCYPAIFQTNDNCLLVGYCRGDAKDGNTLCRLGIAKIKIDSIE